MSTPRKPAEIARSQAYLRFRQRLLAGLLSTGALAVAVFVWQFNSSSIEREAAVKRQTQHFVRAMEAHVVYAIQFVDLSLIGFANAIKVLPPEKSASAETMTALLSSRGATFNSDFWITFINAEGKAVATSGQLLIAGVDYSQRDYFKVHLKRSSSPNMFVGQPALGKVSSERLFFMSRRVESARGEFLGVIVAPLNARRFAEVFENSRVTDDVSISLIHQSGRVIARSPAFEASFNRDLSDSELLRLAAKNKIGSFRTSSAIDRIPRIFSYRVLENVPLILIVGSSDVGVGWVFGPAFLVAGAGLALLLTLMLLSGHFALRSYIKVKERELRYRNLYQSSRETEAKLSSSEESMKLATLMYQNSSEGMMVTDADGAILSVNPAFSRISGYTEQEVVGHQSYELTSDRQDMAFFSQMRRAIVQTGEWEGEVWHQNKHCEHYLVALRFNTVFDEQGQAYRRVALFSDITKKKASEELIWKQANFDALTGLPNRRMFHERLRLEMKKSDRAHLPLALVFIDLDGFKGVNDTLGHDKGDDLLKQVAERLVHCARSTDIVSRLGGDEFTVILCELKNPGDVVRIAREMLKAMAEPFALGEENAHISASIGITLYPEDGADAHTLVTNADQAMYSAKQQGRNCFNYFAPFMQEATRIRMALANELRDALNNNELRVVYQPIVDLASGRICKAEALVRWQHPLRGLLSPVEFIAVAENTGVIVGIGDWVFKQAARQAKRMQQRHGADFQICVNKAAWQFRDDGSNYGLWLNFLDELQLDAHSIVIEVTENLLLDAGNEVSRKLEAFRAAKMQLSLDDFGTGYCSLAFLKRFEIDYLKIDPDFVGNLAEGTDGIALCKAIIAMAHTLDIKVIAEGVESRLQMTALKAAGCDFGQGYLFSRPISGEELENAVEPVDNFLDIHRTTCE